MKNLLDLIPLQAVPISPLQLPNRLQIVAAPGGGGGWLLALSAHLALQGPLVVLDGGNQFNIYPVARLLRRQTSDLSAALGRIRLARGFTCYQMAALLAGCQAGTGPVLVLDLLATFYDENVALPESLRLLGQCLHQLERLASQAPVVVGARPTHQLNPERRPLFERLLAAGQVWEGS